MGLETDGVGGEKLAIDGGRPVRERLLPYGRQTIEAEDEAAVLAALRSDFLTTGPRVGEFERAFAARHDVPHAVAVATGTAALHAAMHALKIGPGDEVIVPTITFAASANAALYVGATPVFADVDEARLLIDVADVERKITPRTKAIVPVDYAGHPADYDALAALAAKHGVKLIADACHATGARYRGRSVGTLADATCFSFHPVKTITTGEGGLITTRDPAIASAMRRFRHHGIDLDAHARERRGSWVYEMTELGYNYRLTDLQCALGLAQLGRLDRWLARRNELAALYDAAFAKVPEVQPLTTAPDVEHGRHLYVIQLRLERLRVDRAAVFAALRAENIGVNVHYLPVYQHRYYRERFGDRTGLCPVAERCYDRMITLPLYPSMTDDDARDVVAAVEKVVRVHRVA